MAFSWQNFSQALEYAFEREWKIFLLKIVIFGDLSRFFHYHSQGNYHILSNKGGPQMSTAL